MALDGRITLDSFSAGDKMRMFQTAADGEPVIYDAFCEDDVQTKSLASGDLDFYYFMKDKADVKLDTTFSDDFIEFCKKSISHDDETRGLPPSCVSDLYYNRLTLNPLSSSIIMQNGSKVYMLGHDEYQPDVEAGYGTYSLYQRTDDGMHGLISAYISETYAPDYFDKSHYVDCKSVPVYSLNEDFIKSVEVVTFNSSDDVRGFIKAFGDELSLSGVSSMMCFNLKTFHVDTEAFDSMLIEPIVSQIAATYGGDEEKTKDAFERCFSWIFSRLPKKSYLRFFNKIGTLGVIQEEASKVSANESNEYIYSVKLNSKSAGLPTNYLSLKSLKSPEDYHDYIVKSVEPLARSVKTMHNDMAESVCANLFNIYNDIVITRMKNVVNEYIISALSAGIIRGDSSVMDKLQLEQSGSIINELATLTMIKYPEFDEDTVLSMYGSIIDNGAESDNTFWCAAFKEYMLQAYGFDMNKNALFFKTVDLVKIALEAIDDFLEKAKEFLREVIRSTDVIGKYALAEDVMKKFNEEAAALFGSLRQDYARTRLAMERGDANIFNGNIIMKSMYDDSLLDRVLRLKNQLQLNVYEYAKTRPGSAMKGGIHIFDAERLMSSIDDPEFEGKKADYMNLYDDFFDKENEMKVSGTILGKREYQALSKTTKSDLVATYEYKTTFDRELLHSVAASHGLSVATYSADTRTPEQGTAADVLRQLLDRSCVMMTDLRGAIDLMTSIVDEAQATTSLSYFGNMMDIEFDALFGQDVDSQAADVTEELTKSKYVLITISTREGDEYSVYSFKLNDDLFLMTRMENFSTIDNYVKTLSIVGGYQFVDVMRGQHYYKESNYQKSNVFSLKVKNSGLSYDEMTSWSDLIYSRMKNGEDTSIEAVSAEYVQIDERMTELSLKELDSSSFFSDVYDYKYLKKTDGDMQKKISEIKQKIYLRNLLEEAIRKSISKYIPVNTTLWKVEFEN